MKENTMEFGVAHDAWLDENNPYEQEGEMTEWECSVCGASNDNDDEFCFDCGEHRSISQ